MSPVCAKGPLPESRQVYMREQLAELSRDHDLANRSTNAEAMGEL